MKNILYLLTILLSINLTAQSDEYYQNIASGIYQHKSLDENFKSEQIIHPQLAYSPNSTLKYLNLKSDTIRLFHTSNPTTNKDVAGLLVRNTFAEIIDKEYRKIYKDLNSEWNVTFEVWSKIAIDGEVYYTDYKLHDMLVLDLNLIDLNQKYLVFAQSDGYDYYYDVGYPEKFNILILDESNSVIFQSGELDVVYGEEFLDVDEKFGDVTYHLKGREGIELNIMGSNYIQNEQSNNERTIHSYFWNGKELKKKSR